MGVAKVDRLSRLECANSPRHILRGATHWLSEVSWEVWMVSGTANTAVTIVSCLGLPASNGVLLCRTSPPPRAKVFLPANTGM